MEVHDRRGCSQGMAPCITYPGVSLGLEIPCSGEGTTGGARYAVKTSVCQRLLYGAARGSGSALRTTGEGEAIGWGACSGAAPSSGRVAPRCGATLAARYEAGTNPRA